VIRLHHSGPWLLPLTIVVAPSHAVDYLTVQQAQQLLFSHASAFIEQSMVLTDAQRDLIRERAGVRQRQAIQPLWRVESDMGELLGWFLLDEVIGKHEFISYALAISAAGEVLGLEIMSYRETHGDQVREQGWRAGFNGKTLADPLRLGRDVPNISGATLSCRNVLDGVRRLLVLHDLVLRND